MRICGNSLASRNASTSLDKDVSMVKPYCEDCGKHRGSCNGYCCDAESRRVRDSAIKFYKFSVMVFILAIALRVLWIVYFG